MTCVFTYGSLMFESVLAAVTGRAATHQPARLAHWRRHALQDRTYPGAVPATGHAIRGIVWVGVHDDELARLDAFEGREYQRVTVSLHTDDGQHLEAQVYQWLAPSLLLEADWSVEHFQREHLRDFHAIHRVDPNP